MEKAVVFSREIGCGKLWIGDNIFSAVVANAKNKLKHHDLHLSYKIYSIADYLVKNLTTSSMKTETPYDNHDIGRRNTSFK